MKLPSIFMCEIARDGIRVQIYCIFIAIAAAIWGGGCVPGIVVIVNKHKISCSNGCVAA